jgi:soluble lytic murein transglycosylase
MKKLLLLSFLTFYLASCSSLKAPSLKSDPQTIKIVDGWKGASCPEYQVLMGNSKFPLHKLAQMRAALLCDQVELPSENDIPPWLLRHYFETRKDRALKIKDNNDYAYALYRLSDYQKRNDEKEAMLILAQKNNSNPELTEKINQKIYELSPRLNPEKLEVNYFIIARDYERNRDFKNAESFYRQALALVDAKSEKGIEDASRIYNRLKQMSRNQRSREDYYKRLDEAIVAIDKMTKKAKPATRKLYSDLIIERARAYWTDGDIEKGRRELNKLLTTEKNPNTTSHTLWILSQMDLEQNKLTNMTKLLHTALKNKPDDQEVLERVLWSLSWSYYSQKKYNNATDVVEENIELVTSKENKARFQYWLAHFHEKAGRISKAQELWSALTENEPFSYYGILAHRDVNKSLTPLKNEAIDEYIDNTYYWLLDLGELELLQDYLPFLEKKSSSFSHKLSLFPLYKKASYPHGGVLLYLSLKEDERLKALQIYPEIAFPLAYKDDIKKNKELVLSIMRQESLFDPNARSFADAFGLLQLIPEKAREVSKSAGIPYKDFKDLYVPETNIALGSTLLDDLKTRFQGRFPFYVASYNAGERPVRNWLNQRYRGVDVEFIEEIPYAETQKYVKLVFRNLFIYKRMLSDDSFQFPVKFWTEGFPY